MFKRISSIAFIADDIADLATLPASPMGAECFVIENASEYKCNSRGEWIIQNNNTTIAPPNEEENQTPATQSETLILGLSGTSLDVNSSYVVGSVIEGDLNSVVKKLQAGEEVDAICVVDGSYSSGTTAVEARLTSVAVQWEPNATGGTTAYRIVFMMNVGYTYASAPGSTCMIVYNIVASTSGGAQLGPVMNIVK